MVQVKDLTEVKVEELWAAVKDADSWWEEVDQLALNGVQRLLESAMEQELVEQLHAGYYKRTECRQGYRNGYRQRSVLTRYGLVPALRVPRDRAGRYQPGVLAQYQRGNPRWTAWCGRCS